MKGLENLTRGKTFLSCHIYTFLKLPSVILMNIQGKYVTSVY